MKRIYVIGGVILLITVSLILAANLVGHATQYTWGYPAANGVAISVRPTQKQYRLGDPIGLSVTMRNMGSKKVSIRLGGDADFVVTMFDNTGAPVPKTPWAHRAESYYGYGGPEARATISLQAGEEFPDNNVANPVPELRIDRRVHITHAGIYHIVVLQALDQWANSVAISNEITVTITK